MRAELKVLFALAILLAGASALKARQPQQIHIALGLTPDTMSVTWLTPNGDVQGQAQSVVQWGLSPDNLDQSSSGRNYSFTQDNVTRTQNVALMRNLVPETRYYYIVGDPDDGWSDVYSFVTLPLKPPYRFGVYGDLGDTNAQSLTSIQNDARKGLMHAVIHVGDFAYDLHYQQGNVGDAFMHDIEPIAAHLPYMTCPGNHEQNNDFMHYTYRFLGQPSNSPIIPSGYNSSGMPNNHFFSFNIGNIHFISMSTEIYFKDNWQSLVSWQYQWLIDDLTKANFNRTAAPWIIMYGHRPMYCSCDDDCDDAADTVRDGPQGQYGMEDLLFKFGVDLYLCGHEHNYERLTAVYKNKARSSQGNVLTNPAATVHIISGSAGNYEQHEPFLRPQPLWSAFRSNTFGWSRLQVFNDTHLYWEQVMTDRGQPPGDMNKVIDTLWIIQNKHGGFPPLQS